MRDPTPVAVCSRSFSRHPVLRAEMEKRFADTRFNDEGRALDGNELVEFLTGREKAITALERIDDWLLVRLPELRLISKVGVGTDMIDFEATRSHGVEVRIHSGTNSRSVAELALAFAICSLRRVPAIAREVREGVWRQSEGRELSGCTVGIVGFGNVGRDLARLLAPFGCELLCHDERDISVPAREAGGTACGLDELLAASDVVSLHLELNAQTRGIIGADRLRLMKPGAVLINTSRGGLVDEAVLKEVLREERLAAAAFDVFTLEPPEDRDLLELSTFLATPHIGGSTSEAILTMGRAAIAGLNG